MKIAYSKIGERYKFSDVRSTMSPEQDEWQLVQLQSYHRETPKQRRQIKKINKGKTHYL